MRRAWTIRGFENELSGGTEPRVSCSNEDNHHDGFYWDVMSHCLCQGCCLKAIEVNIEFFTLRLPFTVTCTYSFGFEPSSVVNLPRALHMKPPPVSLQTSDSMATTTAGQDAMNTTSTDCIVQTHNARSQASLSTIPNELVSEICSYLDLGAVLSLRTMDKSLHSNTSRAMLERLPRLYLHPTVQSIQRFKDFCKKAPAFMRNNVTELVLLAELFERPPSNFEEYFNYHNMYTLKKNKEENKRDAMTRFEAHQALIDIHGKEPDCFDMRDFVKLLSRLPNLRRSVYAASINSPGWNMSTFWLTKSYARSLSDPAAVQRACHFRDLEAKLGSSVFGIWSESLFPSYMGMLSKLKRGVTQLSFGNMQHDYMSNTEFVMGEVRKAVLKCVACSIETLDISCEWGGEEDEDDEEEEPEDYHYMWKVMFNAATCLQDLTINMPHGGYDMTFTHYANTILPAVLTCSFPQLRTFKVIAKLEEPIFIEAQPLTDFLDRHISSLRHLVLHGTPFLNHVGGFDYSMRQGIEHMCRYTDLQSVSIKVQPRSCKHARTGQLICLCECSDHYKVDGATNLAASDFAQLATTLQTPLRNGIWDFGEYVMDSIKGRRQLQASNEVATQPRWVLSN